MKPPIPGPELPPGIPRRQYGYTATPTTQRFGAAPSAGTFSGTYRDRNLFATSRAAGRMAALNAAYASKHSARLQVNAGQ